MVVDKNREAFIPYTRSDIIKLCLQDGQLNWDDAKKFQDFCQILAAYYHFRFHQTLEIIKDNYVPFNPNEDVQPITPPTFEQYDEMERQVIDAFQHIVERANYILLPESIVKRSVTTQSLIDLKTQVDFEDFDRFLCYYRGDSYKKILVKKFFFWQEEKTIDIL